MHLSDNLTTAEGVENTQKSIKQPHKCEVRECSTCFGSGRELGNRCVHTHTSIEQNEQSFAKFAELSAFSFGIYCPRTVIPQSLGYADDSVGACAQTKTGTVAGIRASAPLSNEEAGVKLACHYASGHLRSGDGCRLFVQAWAPKQQQPRVCSLSLK